MSEEEIHGIIAVEVAEAIREVIPDLFGSVKTTLIEEFDRRNDAVTQAATTTAIVVVSFARSQRKMRCKTESLVI